VFAPADHVGGSQVRNGFSAGGRWIRTFGPPARKALLSRTDVCFQVRSRKRRYRRSARGIASMPAVPSMFFHCGRWTLTKSPSDA
jgi:hypothetical protein